MGFSGDPILLSPQRPRALETAQKEAEAALKMLPNLKKRRSRKERKAAKQADPAALDGATKYSSDYKRLEDAKRELEQIKQEEAFDVTAAMCTAEIDEQEPVLATSNFVHQGVARGEDYTNAVLLEWAETEDAASMCPDLVNRLQVGNCLEIFSLMMEDPTCVQHREHHRYPAAACQLMFKLAAHGCPAGASAAVAALHRMLDPERQKCFRRREPGPRRLRASAECVVGELQWVPSDKYLLQAFLDMGYVSPDSPKATQFPALAELAQVSPVASALDDIVKEEQPKFAREHNVAALCEAIVAVGRRFQEERANTKPTPSAPFGTSPKLLTALVRCTADTALTAPITRAAVREALDVVIRMHGDERVWASDVIPELPIMFSNLPSSQAAVKLCDNISGSNRALLLQQAGAACVLLAQHGLEKEFSLTSALDVTAHTPDLAKLLGTSTDILQRLTPEPVSSNKPTGWEVLSTVELILKLVQQALQQQMHEALDGVEPRDVLKATIIPVVSDIAKGIKNRQSVSVLRARLLCGAVQSLLSDASAHIIETAQGARTQIVLMSQSPAKVG